MYAPVLSMESIIGQVPISLIVLYQELILQVRGFSAYAILETFEKQPCKDKKNPVSGVI